VPAVAQLLPAAQLRRQLLGEYESVVFLPAGITLV
jgi:hypothetical protein